MNVFDILCLKSYHLNYDIRRDIPIKKNKSENIGFSHNTSLN